MLAAWAAPQAVPGLLFSVLIKENSLTTCPLAQGASYVRKDPSWWRWDGVGEIWMLLVAWEGRCEGQGDDGCSTLRGCPEALKQALGSEGPKGLPRAPHMAPAATRVLFTASTGGFTPGVSFPEGALPIEFLLWDQFKAQGCFPHAAAMGSPVYSFPCKDRAHRAQFSAPGEPWGGTQCPNSPCKTPHPRAFLCPNLSFASAPNPNPFAGARQTHSPLPLHGSASASGINAAAPPEAPRPPSPPSPPKHHGLQAQQAPRGRVWQDPTGIVTCPAAPNLLPAPLMREALPGLRRVFVLCYWLTLFALRVRADGLSSPR